MGRLCLTLKNLKRKMFWAGRMAPLAAALSSVFGLLPAAHAEIVPIKNHSIYWLGGLYPSMDTPHIKEGPSPQLAFGFYYSSIFIDRGSPQWSMLLDMELMELSLSAKQALHRNVEVGVEQRIARLNGGFLDEFIISFHDLFGFPHYTGQKEAPRNRFKYRWRQGDNQWAAPYHNVFLLRDIELWLKFSFLRSRYFDAGLKILVQAPTGSALMGLSNGSPEGAIVLLLRTALHPLTLNVNLGGVLPTTMRRAEPYPLQAVFFWTRPWPIVSISHGRWWLNWASPPPPCVMRVILYWSRTGPILFSPCNTNGRMARK